LKELVTSFSFYAGGQAQIELGETIEHQVEAGIVDDGSATEKTRAENRVPILALLRQQGETFRWWAWGRICFFPWMSRERLARLVIDDGVGVGVSRSYLQPFRYFSHLRIASSCRGKTRIPAKPKKEKQNEEASVDRRHFNALSRNVVCKGA